MHLVLATRNDGKLLELKSLLSNLDVSLTSLSDHHEIREIVEDGATFLENARNKARVVVQMTANWALADDSGLVVDALGGAPGVFSARYAGRQGDYVANNTKLLREMEGVPDNKRQAAFVCCMVLAAPDGREWAVEGQCDGVIARGLHGTGGFGFDPLFYVPGEGCTMAELPLTRKNEISHRAKALIKIKKILIEILEKKDNP